MIRGLTLGSTAKLMHAQKFQVSRLIIHTTYLDSLERLQSSISGGFRSFDFFFKLERMHSQKLPYFEN